MLRPGIKQHRADRFAGKQHHYQAWLCATTPVPVWPSIYLVRKLFVQCMQVQLRTVLVFFIWKNMPRILLIIVLLAIIGASCTSNEAKTKDAIPGLSCRK